MTLQEIQGAGGVGRHAGWQLTAIGEKRIILKAHPLTRVRFVKLSILNYRIFKGAHEFDLDRQRTVVLGNNATGKTTIASTLAALGPAPGIGAYHGEVSLPMSVDVVTEGNRDLVRQNASLIFLDFESSNRLEGLIALTESTGVVARKEINDRMRQHFEGFHANKSQKIEEYKDLNPVRMAAGERICLYYAYAFALRDTMGLDLPLVLDSPYGRLDALARESLHVFLNRQTCQQIILATENEYRGLGQADVVLKLAH